MLFKGGRMIKKIIKRSLIVLFLILTVMQIKSSIYALNAEYYSKVLWALDGVPYNTKYPAMVYRTFVSAAQTTIDKYNGNGLDKASDGWAYVQGVNATQKNLDYLTVQTDSNGKIIKTPSGPSKTTFRSWSTYFHPNQNTAYVGTNGNMKYSVYKSIATSDDVNSITPENQSVQKINYIEGETSEYKGIYDQAAIWGQIGSIIPDDGSRYKNGIYEILEDQKFLWRMYVKNSKTYVSDMIIQPEHYRWIYGLFSNKINNNEPVYVSSNSYSDHGNITGLDTAYKFYKELSWWGGKTINGGTDGVNSFINYYDNLIRFPKTSNTTIYVRHIDVTGVDTYTSQVINDKSWTSKFKKVGFGRKNYTTPVWSTYDPNYIEYQEKFIIEAKDIEQEDIISIYNKLYDSTTMTRTDGNTEVDSTDYTGYILAGTQVGIGNNMEEATQNRNQKYDDMNQIEVRQSVDVFGDDLGKTIVIDFLYKRPDPEVYIRHIDTTGIANSDINATTVSNYAYGKAYSENGRYIKNVGFAESANNPGNGRRLQETYTNNKEYEYYKLTYADLEQNGPVRFYNKLYSNTTMKSTYGLSRDYTNYKQYKTGIYKNENYKCIIAQGDSVDEAIAERDAKINNKEFQNLKYLDLSTGNITKPYVFIDFYYSSTIQNSETPKLLVRHINVTGMSTVTYKTLDNFVNSSKLGADVFDGYNAGLFYYSNGNKFLNADSRGKYQYKGSGRYYNEIYTLDSNTTYTLYNEFYNSTTESDYEYIGYIMNYNNYALDIAELLRDNKINNVNFNNLNTLDGRAGKGYVTLRAGNNKYIVVDMYYREKETMPIKFADVTGRLTFDSVKNDFTNRTKNTYDVIPSDEEMYASITKASKYMLGGIRIVPMNITNSQTVAITVNVPYKYSYKYWSSTSCTNGHNRGSQSYNSICNKKIKEAVPATETSPGSPAEYCRSRVNVKNYSTGTSSGTVTRTFTYTLPYNYNYYKVSNMRVYKIDHMELYDTENSTDLPLFDGNEHSIGVTQEYKNSVTGSFASSSSSQELLDSRGSIVRVNTRIRNNEETGGLSETVTLNTVAFSEKTFSDKLYTKTTASSKYYNDYVSRPMTNISNAITETTAPTITGANTSGNITNTTASSGARVKFTVSNDKIKIGNEEVLAKKNSNSAREVTTTTNLSGYNGVENKLETTYPDNVYKQYGYSKEVAKTTQSDFIQNNSTKLGIPMARLNGERISNAKIYYKLLEDKNINFDASQSDVTSKKHGWTLNSATTTGSFKDTEMNKDDSGKKVETRIVPGANLPEEKTYSFKSSKTSTSDGTGDVVNVFTPVRFRLSLSNGNTTTNQTIVDHTIGDTLVSSSSQIIQKETRFTITLTPDNNHGYYGNLSEGISKYIDSYYIKFNDLEVQEIEINGQVYNGGNAVASGRWIGPIKNIGNNTKISAIARDNPNEATSVLEQETNTYVIRGVAKNATNSMHKDLKQDDYEDDLITTSGNTQQFAQNTFITSSRNNILRHGIYYIKKKLYNDNNYVAETKVVATKNLSRVYDFKVTDVKDLDWKDTFRKSTTTTINVHSGIVYYSGVNKWNIYSTTFKDIHRRTTDEIGATSQRILPVGPYKNSNSAYVYAPKLGYRFSFDFKTTGKIDKGKEANIDVSFMFIDKTADIADNARLKEVDLYYKNSSNKYVKIDSNDTMLLYYVPNDGYRLTFTENTYNFNTSTLSSSTVKLGSLTKLKLTSKMRAVSDNEYSQIWYGEYKLPNSTIAVDKGETDLNKKKTNGYIAVKFEITVTDQYKNREDITISYSQNDKAATNSKNTSQWDYEGYLGFNNPGNAATNLTLRLDSGVLWKIDDEIYNKLKGTVMLYDVDARAASDYN